MYVSNSDFYNPVFSYSNYLSPGQDVKRYPSGVRLDNQKVLCAPGPRTKYFERHFFRSINYNIHYS